MKHLKIIFVLAFFAWLMPLQGSAQDFVYTPINSNFGGNSYNYNWMLSMASQQNKIEDPNQKKSGYGNDPLEDFQANLNRQILNQLSSKLVNQMFGDSDKLETGTYNLGDYKVDIFEDATGITVNVQDVKTGGRTNVVIPSY